MTGYDQGHKASKRQKLDSKFSHFKNKYQGPMSFHRVLRTMKEMPGSLL